MKIAVRWRAGRRKLVIYETRKEDNMANYDVIVIGAGNGGLASAATLAVNHKKTVVFEKHNIPGGCGTSFRRGRFEFEVALHQLNGMNTKDKPGPTRQLFRKWGIEDAIEWIPIETLYKINLPGGRGVALPADKKKACHLLCREFPEEAEAIRHYFHMVWKFNEEIADFLAKSAASPANPSELKKFITKTGFPKIYKVLAKYGVRSTQDVLDEFFKSRELQLCLSAYWCFMGMPPERFPFSILARCMYLYTVDMPYYVRGGSQVMSQALMDTIRRHGSDVFLNRGVKRILMKNGRAVGVEDENGNQYHARKIISNVSPTVTYAGLLKDEEVPEACRQYFKSYTTGISALTCFIGLDCPPEEIGFTDSFNLIYDSLDANKDFKNAYFTDTKTDPIVATCYTIDDPCVSPPGTSIITAGTLKYGEAWEKLSPEEYHRTKYAAADEIVRRLETRFPGLRGHIEEMEVATPLTHMRYLGHPGGAIYGYEQDLKSSVFFFPQDEFIPGLTFSGGWVNTCGFGPNYAYGDKIAQSILKSS